MIKNSGTEWDLKEKLDVTLERPDVTLYDLIDLLVCHFVFFIFVAVLLGCVSENVCCCICFYS